MNNLIIRKAITGIWNEKADGAMNLDLNISVKQTQLSELKGLFFIWC